MVTHDSGWSFVSLSKTFLEHLVSHPLPSLNILVGVDFTVSRVTFMSRKLPVKFIVACWVRECRPIMIYVLPIFVCGPNFPSEPQTSIMDSREQVLQQVVIPEQ